MLGIDAVFAIWYCGSMKTLLCCMVLCSIESLAGQDPNARFEVVAVHSSTSINSSFSGGPGTASPGQAKWTAMTLTNLISLAYSVPEGRVEWPSSPVPGRFDISATLAPDTNKSQLADMLQNFLKDRFGLQVHRSTKVVSGYELTVAKGGVKLTPSLPESAEPYQLLRRTTPDKDGFPDLPRGRPLIAAFDRGSHSRSTRINQSMRDIVRMCRTELNDAPVEDKTGLDGTYDFKLHYALRPYLQTLSEQIRAQSGLPPLEDEPIAPPDFRTALREQLGLELKPSKLETESIVVDSARKTPTEN